MDDSGPLELHRTEVQPEWIDYNGHMNVAYYVLAFDNGYDRFMDLIGIDASHRDEAAGTIFAVEGHISYQRELKLGDPIRITLQLLGHDRKRLNVFLRMYHAEEGYLAATAEWLSLYVDLASRRVGEMPDPIHRKVAAIMARHVALPRPEIAGQGIRMPMASSTT